MAWRAPHPCGHQGCTELVVLGAYCAAHQKARVRDFNRARGSSTAQGYGARWRRIRRAQLAREPLCRACEEQEGRVAAATEVDHVRPRRAGGSDLPENLQSLCKPCHSRKTAGEVFG